MLLCNLTELNLINRFRSFMSLIFLFSYTNREENCIDLLQLRNKLLLIKTFLEI